MEKCSQCLNAFTMVKLPRKLPKCSHNICEPCLREVIDAKQEMLMCEFCSTAVKKTDIKVFPLNTALLLKIKKGSKAHKPPPVPAPEEDHELLGDDLQEDQPAPEPDTSHLCKIHQIPIDVICATDKVRVCSHCGLFGEHKGHQLKRMEEFETEVAEKAAQFKSLQQKKAYVLQDPEVQIFDYFELRVREKRKRVAEELDKIASSMIEEVLGRKQRAMEALERQLADLSDTTRLTQSALQYQKSMARIGQWEKDCLGVIGQLGEAAHIDEKIACYFESPLEIVGEGGLLLEEIRASSQATRLGIDSRLGNIRTMTSEGWRGTVQAALRVENAIGALNMSSSSKEDEKNPFLDCTTSEIGANSGGETMNASCVENYFSQSCITRKQSTANINTLLAEQKSPAQKKTTLGTPKKGKPTTTPQLFGSAKLVTPNRTTLNAHKRNETSMMFKSPPSRVRIQTEEGSEECRGLATRDPERVIQQFAKDTLTDCLDLSDCGLGPEQLVEYVVRGRRAHKVKKLKLNNNELTVGGFVKMIEWLRGVTSINLTNNQINESILEVLLKYKHELEWLKMITLAGNPISISPKHQTRLEELKKGGVMVVLVERGSLQC